MPPRSSHHGLSFASTRAAPARILSLWLAMCKSASVCEEALSHLASVLLWLVSTKQYCSGLKLGFSLASACDRFILLLSMSTRRKHKYRDHAACSADTPADEIRKYPQCKEREKWRWLEAPARNSCKDGSCRTSAETKKRCSGSPGGIEKGRRADVQDESDMSLT